MTPSGWTCAINEGLGRLDMSSTRSPLLGVCILRTTRYWGCESTVLRGSIKSRGIQCIQCAL